MVPCIVQVARVAKETDVRDRMGAIGRQSLCRVVRSNAARYAYYFDICLHVGAALFLHIGIRNLSPRIGAKFLPHPNIHNSFVCGRFDLIGAKIVNKWNGIEHVISHRCIGTINSTCEYENVTLALHENETNWRTHIRIGSPHHT